MDPHLDPKMLDSPQHQVKGITLLCLASYLCKDEVVKILLNDGRIRADGTDSKNATALMYAGMYFMYIDLEWRVNLTTCSFICPLSLSLSLSFLSLSTARDGNISIVSLLLEYQASPDIVDSHGWSSIQFADRNSNIIKLCEEQLRIKRLGLIASILIIRNKKNGMLTFLFTTCLAILQCKKCSF
jgi:hypothetical protein